MFANWGGGGGGFGGFGGFEGFEGTRELMRIKEKTVNGYIHKVEISKYTHIVR